MKRTVKLTESKLRDMINEAVRGAILSNPSKKRKSVSKKLTESRLRNMIKESVKGVINEIGDTAKGQYMLGRLAQRQAENVPPNKDHDMYSNGRYTNLYALDKAGRNMDGDGSYEPTDEFDKGAFLQHQYMDAKARNDQEDMEHFKNLIIKYYNNYANQNPK